MTSSNKHVQSHNLQKQGRAEATRLALLLGDIPFEDVRVQFSDWPKLKPNAPYGALPMATIDGELVSQSPALLLYAGKLSGLYPSDPKAALHVDEVLATLDDATMVAFSYHGSDKALLKEAHEKFLKEAVPRYIGALDKRLELFGKGPFACEGHVTIADLAIVAFIIQMRSDMMEFIPKNFIDGYPRILAVYDAVMDIPKVKEWYKKRPIC